jgi:hypothetical protein
MQTIDLQHGHSRSITKSGQVRVCCDDAWQIGQQWCRMIFIDLASVPGAVIIMYLYR